jgi:hypothetical protein
MTAYGFVDIQRIGRTNAAEQYESAKNSGDFQTGKLPATHWMDESP